MYITFWRRPTYIENAPGPITPKSCRCYEQRTRVNKQLIPEQLSFDQVLNGETLPPASLNDFMEYLLYVSRSAENLQFLLWCKDYTRRFHALPQSESVLSPGWSPTTTETSTIQLQSKALQEHKHMPISLSIDSFETDGLEMQERVQNQPFRAELNRITQHYLVDGAPRELNLSYRMRNEVLRGLQTTTHPSVLKPCHDLVEQYLRHQSHPNFIRWAITNGRRPRTVMLRPLAAMSLLIFIASEVFLILSGQSRWLRIALSPILLAGLMQIQCMLHGLCVLLFISGEREMRPWEMFANDEEIQSAKTHHWLQSSPIDTGLKHQDSFSSEFTKQEMDPSVVSTRSTLSLPRFLSRINPFGPQNNFDHEPWTEKWSQTPWHKKWSMTFSCSKVPQDDPAVKMCQTRIMWQSFVIGFLVTVLVTAGLVAVPVVDRF